MIRSQLPSDTKLKMNGLLIYLAAVFGLIFNTCAFADQAIIVGGGYNIGSSQGQIELNVKWAQGILAKERLNVTTFYTDGKDPAADVHYRLSDDSEAGDQLPLVRVFSHVENELTRYRNHTVAGVVGGTDRESLEPILEVLLGQNNTEDTLFLYNGHGFQSQSTPDKVYLKLWNSTELSAKDLHGMLAKNQAPFRYVFTQCYSGGFHRVNYKDPEKGLDLVDTERCGFTSESAYQLAEGCSASIDSDDYRDYSTYFFSALSGYDRNGEIIDKDPDTNLDLKVTLREAHLYTLEKAYSTDLSRSSSEDYLTSWEPWFLKWLPGSSYLPNNEYARLYRDVAALYEIPLEKGATRSIRKLQKLHSNNLSQYLDDKLALEVELLDTQHQLQTRAVQRWPDLAGPYTGGFAELALNGELATINEWLSNQPEYQTLVELERSILDIDDDILDSERMVTQMFKLMRLRRLANLKQWLQDYGSAPEIAAYEKLVACEDQPLTQ